MKYIWVLTAPGVTASSSISKCCGQESDYRQCNVTECAAEECIDCVWAAWTEWGACICDGLMERGRTIAVLNNHCGNPCEGPKIVTDKCTPSCWADPKDCEFGDWSEWGNCDATCDGGQQFRRREIATQSDERGTPCDGLTKEVRPCSNTPCTVAQDCVVGDWSEWKQCSVTCNVGQSERQRTIITPAANGGVPCDLALQEFQGCENEPCDTEVDCVWGEWEDFGACSRTCGGGNRSRTRLIKVAPRNGGKLCEPLDMTEVGTCNMESCTTTKDCVFGKWTDWDACSCSCNGIKHRVRHIDVYPGHGGHACEGPLREVAHCNWPCEVQEEEQSLNPIDCILDNWQEWGASSATCGVAQHTRHRVIKQQPRDGGQNCSGELAQVSPSPNLPECEVEEEDRSTIVDCIWSEWDEWGACSASCDGGQRIRQRQIKMMGSKNGAPCPSESSMQVEPCALEECGCEDCQWGEWSDWGACTCTGLVERHRNMMSHFHLCGKPCEGPKVETQSCTPACSAEPVDCAITEWSMWSTCTVTCAGGEIKRTRAIKREAENGGQSCEGVLEEIQGCGEGDCTDLQDCLISDWNVWTACTSSCGGGQQFRDRSILSEEVNGGEGCKGSMKEVKICNEDACGDSRDCLWGQWSEWSACSHKCGGGNKVRDRQVEVAPRHDGKLCDAKVKSEMVACNTQACGEGCRDAEWGSWGNWSQCSVSCGQGFRRRERNILVSANSCGQALDGLMQDFEECNVACQEEQPIDCLFTEWSDFGDCSCSCDGVHDRSRRIQTFASNGGKACDGAMKEVGSCNVGSCNAEVRDCVVSDWGAWTDCTQPCGVGLQERERQIVQEPTYGGQECPESLKEVQGCNEQPCTKAVDCVWGEWVEWGACSRDCGGGQKIRYRHIITLPRNDGAPCERADSVQMDSCNEQDCGVTMYCEFNDWSEWGPCSATCGTGEQVRRRSLTLSPVKSEDVLITGQLNEMLMLSFSELSYIQISSVFLFGMLFSMMIMAIVMKMKRRYSQPRHCPASIELGHEQLLLQD